MGLVLNKAHFYRRYSMNYLAVALSVFIATFLISQPAHSAACPSSSSAETSGANDGDNCTVTDATTGTVIQLNFITGFDSTTLIENDSAGQTATDTYYTSVTSGAFVSSNPTMPATAAAASKASGNNGTTVGAQRKLSFIKAAEIIASKIVTTEPILIDAKFSTPTLDPTFLACTPNGATLGSASASSFIQNASAPGGALNSTWYPVGLYNSLSGSDNYPSSGPIASYPNTIGNGGNINADSDIFTRYNALTGTTGCLESSNGWYYGFDAPPSAEATDAAGNSLPFTIDGAPPQLTYIGFTTVLLHEMLHGLGFSTLTNSSGVELDGLDDIYATFLRDDANNRNWNDPSETAGNRASSMTSGTGLLWTGANVNAAAQGQLTAGYQDNDVSSSFTSGDRVQMYAPNPFNDGSSVAHFDTAVAPDEIMEPQYTEGSLDLGLALYLLKDIGWALAADANTAPTITAVNQTTDEDVAIENVNASGWASDGDGDSLTFSITSCPSDLTCNISSDGTDLDITPDANYNGATNSVTVQVSDGNGGTASDSFNVTVNAVDDAPAWSAIPDQTVTEGGSSVAVNLASYVSDVDGDSITGYSVVSCGAGLDCSNLSGSTLTLSATSNGGATVSVTVRADEGDLTTDTNFNVIINAAGSPTPPPLELNNTPLDASTPVAINNDEVSLSLTDGVTGYNISLTFEGQAANSLLNYSGTEINIAVPDASFLSGQFAGDYVLTLQHIASGNSTQFTFTRAPRLKTSASKLMGATDTQTLVIEGGAAGTVYSLSNDSGDIAFVHSSSSVTSTTAANNSSAFNPATVTLDVAAVTSLSTSTISVTSIYDTATSSLDIYPEVMYELTVEDTSANRLTSATAAVQSAIVTDFNLPSSFSSNQLGVIVLSLPNIGSDIVVRVSQDLYTPKDVTLVASQLTQTVILNTITNPLTLIGNIEASAPLDFQQSLPTVTLTLTDGSEIDIPVTKTSNSLAQFEYVHDLTAGSISNLIIDHANGVRLTLDVINSPGSITYNIFLESSAPGPAGDTSIGSGGGGALGLTALLLILFSLFRLYPRKTD